MENAKEINYTAETLSMVKKFHSQGKYWDVQLCIGDEIFKCQRSLLAAISEYFDTMFSGNFKESNTAKDEPIILHDLDATAFKEILHFAYTGDFRVNDSNVYQLLLMSDFLGLRHTAHIKKQCVEHIKSVAAKHTPMSNVWDLFSFAHMKLESILVDLLSAHICQHFHHYSKDEKLMEISYEHLNALLRFSKNYILSLQGSQNVTLKIIYNWVNYSRKARSKYRCELMKSINFSNVTSEFTSFIMNKLENFADEITGLPENPKSFGKLKTLKAKMVHDLKMNVGQSDAIIVFVVKSVSEMKIDETVFSQSHTISGLIWKMGVVRSGNGDFGCYLYCSGPNFVKVWNCYASANITLISHKKGKRNYTKEIHYSLFSSMNGPAWGLKFLSWDDLVDRERGFIKNDDSVTIQTHVFADVPFNKQSLSLN